MVWVLILVSLAVVIGVFLFLRTRTNEKKIGQLVEDGNFESAIVEYSKLFEKGRLSDDGLWKLSNLYTKTGRVKHAIDKLKYMVNQRRIPEDLSDTIVKIKLSSLLYDEKRDRESLEILLDLYDSGGYIPDTLRKIGTIAYTQKDYTNAKRFLMKYVDIVKNDEKALEMASSSLVHSGNKKQALNLYSHLASLYRTRARHYYNLAICYLSILDFENSKINFENAKKAGASNEMLINCLRGELYSNIAYKELSEAVENSENAFSMLLSPRIEDPDLKDRIVVDKALLYTCLGDPENKPYMVKELKPMVSNIDLYDDKFKKDLVKMLGTDSGILDAINKKDNIENSNEEEPLNGMPLLLSNHGKKKADLIVKWIEMSFPDDLITETYESKRPEKFDTREIFRNYSHHKEEDIEIEMPIVEKPPVKTPSIDILMEQTDKYKLSSIVKETLRDMGLRVIDEVYVEENKEMKLGDGIDFIAEDSTTEKNKYFIAFRRWDSNNIGDFAVKSIADTIKVIKFNKGLLLAPGELSSEAVEFLERNRNINFIGRNQFEKMLSRIV